MSKLLTAVVVLALYCVCGVATAQTVEFRIVEREGQSTISSSADAELNMAVQARIVGGAPGTALGNFSFDIVMPGEPDSFGTLAKGLISNLDGTYAAAIAANASVGRGGLARQYTYFAALNAGFNGLINVSGGTFTNTPVQEIGLVTGVSAGTALLGTPGIDADSDGNPDTWPGSGSTAPLDPAAGATYFGVGGAWIDIYHFRYTATNLTSRTLQFELRGTTSQTFLGLLMSNGVWGAQLAVNTPNTATSTIVSVSVSDTGACCDLSGVCATSSGAACPGSFIVGASCVPTPCPLAGFCCSNSGECSITLETSCTETWMQGGSCTPNLCAQPGVCCAANGTCTIKLQAACTGNWTLAGTCTPNTCPAPSGRCCNAATGECSITTQAACTAGSSWTIAQTCSPNNCPQPSGRCCNNLTAGCSISTQAFCAAIGTWTLTGTCSPNTCPLPLGRCCNGTIGGCTITTAPACTTGSAWALALSCTANPCPPLTACCNATTGACSLVEATGDIVYTYSYAEGPLGYARNDTGGTVKAINATFSPITKRLVFDAYFSGATLGGPLITTGFWLVLDNGPNPKTHPGELAIFYFDATTLASPTLTVYAYNGADANTSWSDGDPGTPGDQPGDLIKGVYETSYLHALIAEDTTVGGQPRRHLKFDIDATDIMSHVPLYPAASPWYGAGFDLALGLWFHPVAGFAAAYETNADGHRGGITSLATSGEGWLDAANIATTDNDPCPSGSQISPAAACTPTNTCPQRRACCDAANGLCVVVGPSDDCPNNFTFASPAASTCSPNPCPAPSLQASGTCCNTLTGACCILPFSGCSPSTHTWHAGNTCSANPCPPPQGACCNVVTGTCAVSSRSACAPASHDWLVGGTCSPNTCAQPGICCNTAAATCRRFTQPRCATGSTWSPTGACSPNPCSLPGPCCNVVTGTCQLTLQPACPPGGHDWMPGATCTPNPCATPGTCCNIATGTCRRFTQTRCTTGSIWAAAGACSPNPCTLPGSCCNVVTGACQLTLQPACPPGGHDWMPAVAGACSPNPCDVIGACCNLTTGACRRFTQDRCSTGGIWIASGVCSPNPCSMPQGACCNVVVGTCAVSTQSDCAPAAHDWVAGGACAPNTCPAPAACCNALSGVCRRLTEIRCMVVGGDWLTGQSCTPSPCSVSIVATCTADFDHSGHADVQDVLAFLTAWFALDLLADMHSDGEIDAADIFDFLAAWFAGCP
jgi:hypothetical protein